MFCPIFLSVPGQLRSIICFDSTAKDQLFYGICKGAYHFFRQSIFKTIRRLTLDTRAHFLCVYIIATRQLRSRDLSLAFTWPFISQRIFLQLIFHGVILTVWLKSLIFLFISVNWPWSGWPYNPNLQRQQNGKQLSTLVSFPCPFCALTIHNG